MAEAMGTKTEDYNQSLKLTLNVETVESTQTTASFEIGMTAELTSKKGSEEMTATSEVSSVDDYVTIELQLQPGLTIESVLHSGKPMTRRDDLDPEYDTTGTGVYGYNATSGVLTLKTKNFSPFDVTYTAPEYVAQVGNLKYPTLAEAIAGAKATATETVVPAVKLLKDITLTANVDFDVAGGELDLAGYKITGNLTVSEDVDGATIKNGSIAGTLTVSGDSALIEDLAVTDGIVISGTDAVLKNCEVEATGVYAVNVTGNATIKSGTYKAATTGEILNGSGSILVEDGYFKGTLTDSTSVSLKGGIYEHDVKANVAVGYECVKVSDGVYKVREKAAVRNITTEVEYFSFEEALSTAKDGEELLLLKEIVVAEETVVLEKAVTIYTGDFSLINYSYITGKFDETTEDEGVTSSFDYCVDSAMDSESRGIYSIRHCDARIESIYFKHLADAFAAVEAGVETTIHVNGESRVANGITVPAGKIIILELDGKTVMGNTDSTSTYALITNYGTLTIQDSTDTDKDGTGKGLITTYITNPDKQDVPGYASNTITNLGTLTVNSGKIVNNGKGYACFAIDNQTNGTSYNPVLTINGGRFEQMNASTYAIRMFCNSTTNVNRATVNGGVISGGYGFWLQTPNDKANKAKLTINGGVIDARDGAALYIGGTKAVNSEISIDITDGVVGGTGVIIQGPLSGEYGHVAIVGGKIANIQCGLNVEDFISGGLFGKEPGEAYYIAYGCTVGQSGDEKYPFKVISANADLLVNDGDTVTTMSLNDFRESVNGGTADYTGKTVTLLRNIELSGTWEPIGSKSTGKAFSGTFDGAGHTISNLSYYNIDSSGQYIAFFGLVENAVIENLTVSGNITAYQNAGGIVARAVGNTTIRNVTNKVNVTAADKAGGIICAAYPNITASGADITDKGCVVSVIGCTNSGDITCNGLVINQSNPMAGGIIANASNFGKVICEGCVNTASVSVFDEKGEAVAVAGPSQRGYVMGISSAQVKYSTELFVPGVYLFNCINTNGTLYPVIGSANGIVNGPYKIYVKDKNHASYGKLSDTAGAVYYDNGVFHN